MNEVRPGEALPRHLGNMDANLRFLEATGVLMPQRDILEIGSGTGALLHELRTRGLRAQGIELRQAFIEQARAWYGDIPITPVTGLALPFPDASFDVVMSFDVLEHIPDTDGHLQEVARVLRPGGSYVLQTPNKWTNVVFETLRWRSFTAWREEHCSLHSLGELDFARLCRERGLPEPTRQAVCKGPDGRVFLDVRWECGLVVEIDGVRLIMLTTDLAGVGKSEIGVRVGSLMDHRDTIRDAVERAESELGTRGRVVLRASGTEPVIRVMVEGEDHAQVHALAERLADSVRESFGSGG